jgi:hypothetical protein
MKKMHEKGGCFMYSDPEIVRYIAPNEFIFLRVFVKRLFRGDSLFYCSNVLTSALWLFFAYCPPARGRTRLGEPTAYSPEDESAILYFTF